MNDTRRRFWTGGEESRLRQMVGDGLPRSEIAARLNRTVGSIDNKVQKMKLVAGVGKGRYACPEKLSWAWTLFAEGMKVKDVAATVGLHPRTAYAYRSRMPPDWAEETDNVERHYSPMGKPAARPANVPKKTRTKAVGFTPEQIATIRRLSVAGQSSREIAATVGKAESSVRIKMKVLAIEDRIAEDGCGGSVGYTPTGKPYYKEANR